MNVKNLFRIFRNKKNNNNKLIAFKCSKIINFKQINYKIIKIFQNNKKHPSLKDLRLVHQNILRMLKITVQVYKKNGCKKKYEKKISFAKMKIMINIFLIKHFKHFNPFKHSFLIIREK